MKNTRKLIALFLVVAAMMTLIVLPVSAAGGGGEVEPNVVVTKCDKCGGNVPKTPVRYYNEIYKRIYDNLNSNHVHEYVGDYDVYTCNNCGKKYINLIRERGMWCSTYPHCLRELSD